MKKILVPFVGAMLVGNAQAQALSFTNVTFQAGLHTEYYSSPTRHSLGVVWFDANNDGYPDILATNGFDVSGSGLTTPNIYINNQDGTFTTMNSLLPVLPNYDFAGALAADYDRDGDVDLFLYTANEAFFLNSIVDNPLDGPPNLLLKNMFVESGGLMQAGMFVDVTQAANLMDCPAWMPGVLGDDLTYGCYQTRSATFLDYNLDGWIDLYVGHMVINRAGSISDPKLDSVGKLANQDVLYRNNGDGTFSIDAAAIPTGAITSRSTLVVRSGHLNGDIWPDIYVGHVGNNPFDMLDEDLRDTVLINNGAGQFVASQSLIGADTPAAMGIDFGDVNGDGAFDIYISDVPNHYANRNNITTIGNTLYLSRGPWYGSNVAWRYGLANDLSWGVNFADFDLDGKQELFVGAGRENVPSVIYSEVGNKVPGQLQLGTFNVRGSALADYDLDGDQDLLVINEGGGLQLYQNNCHRDNHNSLIVELAPSASNADCIGAKVVLTTASGQTHVRQIKGGTSSHSQDETKLFFGLGADSAQTVHVHWPVASEQVTVLSNITGNHIVVSE